MSTPRLSLRAALLTLLCATSSHALAAEHESREQWGTTGAEAEPFWAADVEAATAMESKDYSTAETLLQKTVEWCQTKRQPDALLLSASTSEQRDALLAAMPPASRVIWVNDVCPNAYKRLAFLEVERGNIGAAVTHLDRATEIAPLWAEPYLERGFIMNHLNRFDDARACYEKGLELAKTYEPKSKLVPIALRGLGFALIELGELDAAEKAFKQALRFEPDSELAINELEYIESLRARSKVQPAVPGV